MIKKLLLFFLVAAAVLTVSCSKNAAQKSQTVAPQQADETLSKEKMAELDAERKLNEAANKPPVPLPGYTPTGNPDVDAANYSKAKEDLYNNHPEQYQQWVESMQGGSQPTPALASPQVTEIPYEQYMQLPQARRDYIDAHPELFKVVK